MVSTALPRFENSVMSIWFARTKNHVLKTLVHMDTITAGWVCKCKCTDDKRGGVRSPSCLWLAIAHKQGSSTWGAQRYRLAGRANSMWPRGPLLCPESGARDVLGTSTQKRPLKVRNRAEIMSNLTNTSKISVELVSNRVVTDPGGLKPAQIHQIKGQTALKIQHSNLIRRSISSLQ